MSAVALQSFGFGEQLVRVVDREGGIWFVANDVCAALEISNPRDAVGRLEDDERDGVGITDTIGRLQEMMIISESGLYALIFRSRKPIAVQFRKWVTQEVLPAIRKTGHYDGPAAANDRTLDLSGALGTEDDKHTIRTAIFTVQMYKDLWGPQAGRDMAQKLGFPVPGVNLPRAPSPDMRGFQQVEGDLHQWSVAAKLKPSKRGATHLSDLFASYTQWCSATGAIPMHSQKFKDAMIALFNHEEHPEMICVVLCGR